MGQTRVVSACIARELRLLALRAERGDLLAVTVVALDARQKVHAFKLDESLLYPAKSIGLRSA